jgi:hypothetical protein
MKYETAIKYYGSAARLRAALGVSRQALSQFKAKNLMSRKSALRLQTMTGGKLKVQAELYERANGAKSGA